MAVDARTESRFAMAHFCYEHGGRINGDWTQDFGYIVETEHYRYCLRCNPPPGDYNAYLTCFDLDVQRQNMAQEKLLVGRVTFVGDDAQEFTDAEQVFIQHTKLQEVSDKVQLFQLV